LGLLLTGRSTKAPLLDWTTANAVPLQ